MQSKMSIKNAIVMYYVDLTWTVLLVLRVAGGEVRLHKNKPFHIPYSSLVV